MATKLPCNSQMCIRDRSYSLATGERLATTENPAVFETLDRSRRFTLRQP